MSIYLDLQDPTIACPYCQAGFPLAGEGTILVREGKVSSNIRECPGCSREFVLKVSCKADLSCQALKIEGVGA